MSPRFEWFKIFAVVCMYLLLLFPGQLWAETAELEAPSVTPLRLDQSRPIRYARSFMDIEGRIHMLGLFLITDQGRKVTMPRDNLLSTWGGPILNESRINMAFHRSGLFLGLHNRARPLDVKGKYYCSMWRSFDNLKTLTEERTTVILPEAGKVEYSPDKWLGLFFHRGIVELTDGSLLASMYGNFEQDKTTPDHPHSKRETIYKLRAFAVRSTDQGETWRYRSTLADPKQLGFDDSEGFNEWDMVRLEDGRLLAVIRTGHFTPMYACWSSDEGLSWTEPVTPEGLGLGGADPCLISLHDGRVALAYGEMVQPSETGSEEFWETMENRLNRLRRCCLAVSDDYGETWATLNVSDYAFRSAYPSIFEVAPDTILYQADLELWRVAIPPK